MYVLPLAAGEKREPREVFRNPLPLAAPRFSPDGKYLSYIQQNIQIQKGEVFVGNEDGYYTTITTETNTSQSVNSLKTGTRLTFRPFIASDGYIITAAGIDGDGEILAYIAGVVDGDGIGPEAVGLAAGVFERVGGDVVVSKVKVGGSPRQGVAAGGGEAVGEGGGGFAGIYFNDFK